MLSGMKRRTLVKYLALPALMAVGAAGYARARPGENPYYQGPRSDHFDGLRFFTPGQPPDKGFLELMRWQFGGNFPGLIEQNIAWLSTPNMAMTSAVLLNVWKYTPFVVICVLARLQTIPTELYDAAKVDGAGAWRRFIDITLPMLKEVLVVVVVFRTIWTFNKFEEIYLLTRGGPGTSTFNLAVYAFEEGMANLRLGVAAATGVIMIAMLLVGTVIYVRVSGFGQEDKAP